MLQIATAGAASLGLPMLNLGRYHVHAVASAQRYSGENIAAVLGGNFRRLLAAIWK
jgi:hypothetical protein